MKPNLFLTYFLGTVLCGCGTGSSGPIAAMEPSPVATPAPAPPPAPASTVPVITGLTAHFSDSSCTRAADGLHGRALVITFDYVDGGNDLVGGYVQLSRLYNTGRSEWHDAPIPSEAVLSGSPQRGEADINDACPLFDNNSSETETVTLVDASGNASNSLSVTVDRPAGAP
jgi:hypothetical protein